jgi:hypothetical protein
MRIGRQCNLSIRTNRFFVPRFFTLYHVDDAFRGGLKTHIPFTLKPFFKSCEFDGFGQQVDTRLMLLVKERGEEKGSV